MDIGHWTLRILAARGKASSRLRRLISGVNRLDLYAQRRVVRRRFAGVTQSGCGFSLTERKVDRPGDITQLLLEAGGVIRRRPTTSMKPFTTSFAASLAGAYPRTALRTP